MFFIFVPIWAQGPWAHMGQGPWAHGPGPILKIFVFLDVLVCQRNMFFEFLDFWWPLLNFSFLLKMFASGLSKFDKFIEMCQIYWVLLSWFYFSLKTYFVKLSHLESVLREFCPFKTSGLPGPGQSVYFLEIWLFEIFWDFLKKWRPPPLANNPKRETPICSTNLNLERDDWRGLQGQSFLNTWRLRQQQEHGVKVET